LCVKRDILASLCYFDIFDYPITQLEISQFIRNAYRLEEIADGLHSLTVEQWIYKFGELYTLQNNYDVIARRKKGNVKARQMLVTAQKIAAILSSFPFIKGVGVSGSLSKNFADIDADIDFFIITEENRLWLARTILMAFRRLTIPFRKDHLLCLNYFIDEKMLEIEEKNIYTATEVATLLPFRGIKTFQKFFRENQWTQTYLPNHALRVSYVQETRNPILKKFVEFLFRNQLGNFMDSFFMRWTRFRFNKRVEKGKENSKGYLMDLKISKHYAKHNPDQLQKKITEIYEKKIVNLFGLYENNAKTVF
jgi:hypothetical protein